MCLCVYDLTMNFHVLTRVSMLKEVVVIKFGMHVYSTMVGVYGVEISKRYNQPVLDVLCFHRRLCLIQFEEIMWITQSRSLPD